MNQNRWAIILGAGLVVAALVFGMFFYAARKSDDTIRVVGYATEEFEADIVKWSFNLSVMVPLDGLESGYERINDQLHTFQSLWSGKEIPVKEMNIQPVQVQKQYGEYGRIVGHILQQNVYVISEAVDAVEQVAVNPVEFTRRGLAFEYSNIEYFSSTLPEIKKQLLAEATRNARERAEEIIGATENRIKKILSARAGVFQITEPYSTDVAGYGIHTTSTRKKTIKVTVSAAFAIE